MDFETVILQTHLTQNDFLTYSILSQLADCCSIDKMYAEVCNFCNKIKYAKKPSIFKFCDNGCGHTTRLNHD